MAARRAELDGVRGVAIGLVLFGHGAARFQMSAFASAGVTLFFALSGYLITGILLNERESTGSVNLRGFYWRRFTRLAPPLVLLVVVISLVDWQGWGRVLPPLTWTTNYFSLGDRPVEPFGQTWSLAVEEQFYLVWPPALALLLRVSWQACRAISTLLVVLITWRVFLVATDHWEWSYLSLEAAGSAIVAGCWAAMTGWRPSRRLVLIALASVPAAGSLAAVMGGGAWMLVPLWLTPSCLVIVAGADRIPLLSWPPLGACGLAAYSLYLWHDSVSRVLFDALNPVGVAAGAALGWAAYLAVERPVMRWRSGQTD